MQNDYNNRYGQTQTAEKGKGNGDFARSAIKQGEEKAKDMSGDIQKQLKEGQEQAGQIISAVDKQVRENPWPVIAGVAIGSFLLGSLISKSNK